jgi:hypothetical protein
VQQRENRDDYLRRTALRGDKWQGKIHEIEAALPPGGGLRDATMAMALEVMAEVASGRPEPEVQQLAELVHVNRHDVSRYLGILTERVPLAFDDARGDEMAADAPHTDEWEDGIRFIRRFFGRGKQFLVAREFLYSRLADRPIPAVGELVRVLEVTDRTVRAVKTRAVELGFL